MLRNQKGFTLMELMVVIVIVAILAAVAVPLYINYVKDAQRTEAKGAIGAITTAQQAYYQKNLGQGYATTLAELEQSGQLDITEAKVNWGFVVAPHGGAGDPGFKVTATGIASRPANGLVVVYEFTRNTGGVFDPVAPPPPPQQP